MSDKPYKIFVVEDDDWYNRLLVHHLSLNPDFQITSFNKGKDCIDKLSEEPDVVTLDYRLPDMKGLEVLKKIKEVNDDIQVILISEQNEIDVVVELLKYGAYDYIVKSRDIRERLLNTVNNIRKGDKLKRELVTLRKEVKKKYNYEKTIVGSSKATQKIYDLIDKATRTNISVAITGATGTGKELVAKAIHYNSGRAGKPFVAVNMAAIPKDLVESELFGHEKGAFTGANFRRLGKFEEATGGTLFLDEVAEMDIALQTRLLRVLQEKEIVRVGSNTPIKVDCRIIVATNRNFQDEVKKGNFRQALYYRIYGLQIELPPLRDRGNDLLILAKHFVQSFCVENGLPGKIISVDAINKLRSYSFPGNIRELRSIMELAVTLTDDEEISSNNIILGNDDILPDVMENELSLREYNIKIVNKYLEKYDNNIKLVAQKLDIGVATIYRMLKQKPTK